MTGTINADDTLSLPPEGELGEDLPLKPSQILAGLDKNVWENELSASSLVACGEGSTPLVLDAGRLYLRRFWDYTRKVAQAVSQRMDYTPSLPDNLAERLDSLFSSLQSPADTKEINWQKVAVAVSARGAFSIISGGPGTGKTTTVVQLLGLLQGLALEKEKKLRIRLAAPTGKAAARLTESLGQAVERLPKEVQEHIPDQVTTLHRLLGSRPNTRHFIHNAKNPLHVDLLILDEASMIDLEMMAALLDALPKTARLILLGDKDQLASVEAGSVLGDLCQSQYRNGEESFYTADTVQWLKDSLGYDLSNYAGPGTHLDQQIVVLRKSHRFDDYSGIGYLARKVNQGDPKGVEAVWHKGFSDICRLTLNSCNDIRFTRLILDGVLYDYGNCDDGNYDDGNYDDGNYDDGNCDDGNCGDGNYDLKNSKNAKNINTKLRGVGYRSYLERIRSGQKNGESEDEWLAGLLMEFNRFQILSALRKNTWGVAGLNKKIASILNKEGLISRTEGWYPGRPVLVTHNDYGLGLLNGDVGILLPVMDDRHTGRQIMKVVFPMFNGTLKKVLPSRLNHVETVYAMTVHKSQGSEFEHTALILPDRTCPVLTRELVYTGITRAKSRFTLVTPRPELMAASVKRPIIRTSGLGDFLDKM